MYIYHGTNLTRPEDVKVLKMSYGRFGKAVYFSRDKDYVKMFGSHIFKAKINEDDLLVIDYMDLLKFSPDLSVEDEEGLTNLKDFIPGKDMVEIRYDDGSSEIVIYKDVPMNLPRLS